MPRRKVVVPFGVQRGPRAGCLWFGAAGTKKEEEDEEGREGLRWRGAKAMMRENYWKKTTETHANYRADHKVHMVGGKSPSLVGWSAYAPHTFDSDSISAMRSSAVLASLPRAVEKCSQAE
mmetsp:Transcript_112298/g.318369  ORF Transcript_112298/g.318369 Transcript_112298/m.318369 type:complete len:121 (+) Transcript_112298:200-562(+)